MILSFLNKYREAGILLFRVAIGLLLIRLGFPVVAAFELIGGILLIVGLLTRVICLVAALALTVQGIAHLGHHPGLASGTGVAARAFILYALLLIGPGKYSVDKD